MKEEEKELKDVKNNPRKMSRKTQNNLMFSLIVVMNIYILYL